jgi:hypothetical protein
LQDAGFSQESSVLTGISKVLARVIIESEVFRLVSQQKSVKKVTTAPT